jgi:hypothetical protein
VSDSRTEISRLEHGVSGLGCRSWGFGFWVYVWGVGFWIYSGDSGFGYTLSLGFRVSGLLCLHGGHVRCMVPHRRCRAGQHWDEG